MTRRPAVAVLLSALVLLGGCEVADVQNALAAAGPQAARIERLWWPVFWLLSAVWVATMGVLAGALFRRSHTRAAAVDPNSESPLPPPEPDARDERGLRTGVSGAVALTVVILIGLLVSYFVTDTGLTHVQAQRAVVIDVTGKQWWWQVEYRASSPSLRVTTANEIHIPVGEPVLVNLRSTDVIHSLWVPNLHGKKDLIPGHETGMWLQADSVGAYRAECAEFCGYQHAKMALWVIAEPRAEFERWYRGQLAAASPPADPARTLGQQLFVSRSCVLCHTVRGTPAGGKAGPDLTHVASRRTIAAGSLPLNRGTLGVWIVNPQAIKPGAKMPPTPFEPHELEALTAYLEGLR